jgi:lipopolysaccharide export system permease protein
MSIIARYLIGQYFKAIGICLATGVGLFLTIDFFNALDNLKDYEPELSTVAAYFALKLPNILREVYPAAALLAVLISLGTLARHHEILAFRACGISTWRLALPLLYLNGLLSTGMLVWNETVVPPTSAESRRIRDMSIMKKRSTGAFNASSLWFQGREGFFNIDYFDANRRALFGLTLYETDSDFRLLKILEVPEAFWRGEMWEISGGLVKELADDGEFALRPMRPGELVLSDPPSEFANRRQKTKELGFAQLWRRIAVLRARGLHSDAFEVDLHSKLSLPFAGLVTVLVGFPLAVRGGGRGSVASNLIAGLAVGFAYWVTMGIALSIGRTGGLPPIVAAWTANVLFAAIGAALYVGSDI